MPYDAREMKQILRHNLLLDATLVDLVAHRVFTAHGRDTEEATRHFPTLIVELRGGSEFEAAPVARRQLFLYGYSNVSQDQASEIYGAAADVIRRGVGLSPPVDGSGDPCFDSCGYFTPQNVVLDGWNSQIGAWFTRGSWIGWQIG